MGIIDRRIPSLLKIGSIYWLLGGTLILDLLCSISVAQVREGEIKFRIVIFKGCFNLKSSAKHVGKCNFVISVQNP